MVHHLTKEKINQLLRENGIEDLNKITSKSSKLKDLAHSEIILRSAIFKKTGIETLQTFFENNPEVLLLPLYELDERLSIFRNFEIKNIAKVIELCPAVMTKNKNSITDMFIFLSSIGDIDISNFICANPNIMEHDVTDMECEIISLHKIGFSKIGSLISENPDIIFNRHDRVLAFVIFLYQKKFSEPISFIEKNPKILNKEICENFGHILTTFIDFGIINPGVVLERAPKVFLRPLDEIKNICRLLVDIGLDLNKLVSDIPAILYIDEKRLLDQIEMLKDIKAFNKETVEKHPEFLFLDIENIKYMIEKRD